MYTEKEIVEKGLGKGEGPSLPRLASCKLDLQMVPCGFSFEESSKDLNEEMDFTVQKVLFSIEKEILLFMNEWASHETKV